MGRRENEEMMKRELFKTFFKVGAFTLGGGYAMIPIIESEVVEKHRWITKEEFIDLIAVPTFNLGQSAHLTLANCWIPIATALLIWLMGVNPIFIILAAGIGGYLYGMFLKPTE